MEFCICSICNQRQRKDTSLPVYFEDGSVYYICKICANNPVITSFCSEYSSTENLYQIYNEDTTTYEYDNNFM